MSPDAIGRMLLILGGVIVFLGVLFILLGRLPFFGRLPGDIIIQRDNFTFYFPLVTFLIVSIVLTILVNIVIRLLR